MQALLHHASAPACTRRQTDCSGQFELLPWAQVSRGFALGVRELKVSCICCVLQDGVTRQVCVTVLSLQSLSAPAAWIAEPVRATAPALSPLLTLLATAATSLAPLAALPALQVHIGLLQNTWAMCQAYAVGTVALHQNKDSLKLPGANTAGRQQQRASESYQVAWLVPLHSMQVNHPDSEKTPCILHCVHGMHEAWPMPSLCL